mmetsp:Transcript_34899/g.70563  ORF Transcript_34899/g.70563 Transcript_34899/m.70563 type:complete len:219 (+) Transcript_34899:357-1013(+)
MAAATTAKVAALHHRHLTSTSTWPVLPFEAWPVRHRTLDLTMRAVVGMVMAALVQSLLLLLLLLLPIAQETTTTSTATVPRADGAEGGKARAWNPPLPPSTRACSLPPSWRITSGMPMAAAAAAAVVTARSPSRGQVKVRVLRRPRRPRCGTLPRSRQRIFGTMKRMTKIMLCILPIWTMLLLQPVLILPPAPPLLLLLQHCLPQQSAEPIHLHQYHR